MHSSIYFRQVFLLKSYSNPSLTLTLMVSEYDFMSHEYMKFTHSNCGLQHVQCKWPSQLSALLNPSVSVSALMTLTDFTLSNARRFYSSMGNPSDTEGLNSSERKWFTACIPKFYIWTCKWCHGGRCPGIEAFSHFLSFFNAGTSLEKKKNTLTLTTCLSDGPLEKFVIKGCVLLGRI